MDEELNIKINPISRNFGKKTAKFLKENISKSLSEYEYCSTLKSYYFNSFINLTSNNIYDIGCSMGPKFQKLESRYYPKNINYYRIIINPKIIDGAIKRKYKKLKVLNLS